MAATALVVVPSVAGLFGGVPLADLNLFIAWMAGFIVLPGLVVHRAAFGQRNWLESLAVGVPLGYAGQLLIYLVGASAGLRELHWLWPIIGLIGCGVVGSRRQPGSPREAAPPRAAIATASVVTVVGSTLLLVPAYFNTPVPLPAEGATYYADLVYHHSIAAEALHHWPIQGPWAAGTEFNYHWFFHVYAASVGDVTGIDLVWVIHRLYLPPMLALIGVQLTFLGWHVTRHRSVAILAPALFFLAGELDLLADLAIPFLGTTLTNLWLSPTYTYGLILFLAAVAVIGMVVRDRRTTLGIHVALAVLLAAGSGAKGSLLPTLIGGLSLVGAWQLVRNRRLDPVVLRLVLIAVAIFALAYVFVYGGAGGRGLEFDPLQTLTRFPLAGAAPTGARYLVGAVSLFLLLIPLAGFLALNRLHDILPSPWLGWLGALTAVAVAAFVTFDHDGVSQLYFLHYGYTAGLVVSAAGLRHMALTVAKDHKSLGLLAVLMGGCVTAVILVILLSQRFIESMTSVKVVVTYTSSLAVVGVIAALVDKRRRDSRTTKQWSAAVLGILLVVGLTSIDNPLDIAGASRVSGAEASHRAAFDDDFTEAMRWLRFHSDSDEVLAVDNHFHDIDTSRFYAYSAYSERRVFLESWYYSSERRSVPEGSQPFSERLELNRSVFINHDREALEQMISRWGVRYLIHDKARGYASERWWSLGTIVFENGAATVVRVD